MSEMTEVELAALLKTRDESWEALKKAREILAWAQSDVASAMDLYRDSLAAYRNLRASIELGGGGYSVSGISEPVGPKPSSE